MADLNSTLVHGNLRVTEDTNITGNLTVNGSSVAFPSAIKISGITSNGALYYNSSGTISISAIPAAQINTDWNATAGKSSILNKPTIIISNTSNTADWIDFKSHYGTLTFVVGASLKASDAATNPYLKVYQSETTVGYYETHYGTDGIDFTGSATGIGSFAFQYLFPEHGGTFAMLSDIPTDFPPKVHTSTDTTYGAGTTANYGHVKLVSGNVSGTTYTNGVAAAASHHHDGVYLKAQTQADWNVTTATAASYIKNKPTLGTAASMASTAFAPADHWHDYIAGSYSESVAIILTGHPSAGDVDIFYADQYGTGIGTLDGNVIIDMDGTNSILSLSASSILFNGSALDTAAFCSSGTFLKTQYTSTFSVYGGTTCAVTFNQSANRSITFSAGAGITISASAVNSSSGKITISAPLYAHYCAWIYSASEFKFDINFTLYLSTSAPTNPISVSAYLAYASNPMMVTPANGVVTIDACSVYGYKSIFCNVTGIGLSSSALFFRMFSIYTLSGSIATFNFTNSPYLPSVFPTYSDILTNCSWYDTVVAM